MLNFYLGSFFFLHFRRRRRRRRRSRGSTALFIVRRCARAPPTAARLVAFKQPQFCFYQSDDYPIDLWAGLDDPTRLRLRVLAASLHAGLSIAGIVRVRNC